MSFRKAIATWLNFIDYLLSADFDSEVSECCCKGCQKPARITYYNANTRPRSRQRGEGVVAVRSYVNGCQ